MTTKPKKPIRDIPAYQEYAADLLANRHYRLMSLAERGLWDMMRKECWVNKSVPADLEVLAKLLGLTQAEVKANFTDRVKSFFESDGLNLCSPELDKYKQRTIERRIALSEGGRNGGLQTQKNIKDQASLEAQPKPLSSNEQIRAARRGDEFSNEELQEWANDYDNAGKS